ncbi:MAG: RHS repeat-associated core domain-containing protein, partial [Flavobacteriaceae bacterium]
LKHGNYNQVKKELRMADTLGEETSTRRVEAETAVVNSYKYKYNSAEYQDELNLNMYDLGARLHDPARVQFGGIDPRAEEYYSQSPYVFAANNPVFFVDINGEGVDTDYIVLKNDKKDSSGNVTNKKGDIVRADPNDGSEKDATDRILSTDSNDNVRTKSKREGGMFSKKVRDASGNVVTEARTLMDGIAKNIISDGMNFQDGGNIIKFGGTNQATFDEVRTFLVGFADKVVNKEIAGYEAVVNSTNQKSVWTYKYINNTATTSQSRVFKRKGITFTTHFHTHPGGDNTPSTTDYNSKTERKRQKQVIPSVIYYSTGKNKSASQKY